jgi:hypothetical protein
MLLSTWVAIDSLLKAAVKDPPERCRLTCEVEKLWDVATLEAYHEGCKAGRYRMTRRDAAEVLRNGRLPGAPEASETDYETLPASLLKRPFVVSQRP